MTHILKTWPEYFNAILEGRKTFEVREDDRDFKVGDILILNEYDPQKTVFTSRSFSVEVTYKLDGGMFGIVNGFCVMGIKKCQ